MAEHFADVLRGHGAIASRPAPSSASSTGRGATARCRTGCSCATRPVAAATSSASPRGCAAPTRSARATHAPPPRPIGCPRQPARRCAAFPALDMLTWWWPNDPKLMAPAVLADARSLREQWLPPVLSVLATDAAVLTGHELAVVQYVPEHRLTARVDLHWQLDGRAQSQAVYAKSSREPDGASAHAILRTLQSSAAWQAGRLNTPRALLWQPQAQLHWQQGVGRPGAARPAARASRGARAVARRAARRAARHPGGADPLDHPRCDAHPAGRGAGAARRRAAAGAGRPGARRAPPGAGHALGARASRWPRCTATCIRATCWPTAATCR